MSSVKIIIGCSKEKALIPKKAAELYISDRFLAAKEFASYIATPWLILSAKHGILEGHEKIAPYDYKLNDMSNDEQYVWAKRAAQDILKVTTQNDNVIFIGDEYYFSKIKNILTENKLNVFLPLEYVKKINHTDWLRTFRYYNKKINTFYDILHYYSDKYGLIKDFSSFTNKEKCPKQGLYIFLHKDEKRLLDPTRIRIARVGTHAVSQNSKTLLWHRLKTHKGTNSGYGNHRSSIFRSYVGSAIIEREKLGVITWNKKTIISSETQNEKEIEKRVSEYINDNFQLICLDIPGEALKTNDRAYIERNLIALLSNSLKFSDTPPANWLGSYAPNELVKKSGLWNVNHTEEMVTNDFYDIFEHYLQVSSGLISPQSKQLAPIGWSNGRNTKHKQLNLL